MIYIKYYIYGKQMLVLGHNVKGKNTHHTSYYGR